MAGELELSIPGRMGLSGWTPWEERLKGQLAELDGILGRTRKYQWMLDANPDVSELSDSDLNTYYRDLNYRVDEYEDARKALKKTLAEPYEAVHEAGEEWMKGIKDAQAACKEERAKRRAEWEGRRREALETEYAGYAPFLAEALPYGRIEEREWLLKSTPEDDAIGMLHARCREIAGDLEDIRDMGLEYADEAEAEYLRTLSASAAMERDAQLRESRGRVERMEGERSGYAPRDVWCICFEGTRRQADEVLAAAKAAGVGGRMARTCEQTVEDLYRRVFGNDGLEEME